MVSMLQCEYKIQHQVSSNTEGGGGGGGGRKRKEGGRERGREGERERGREGERVGGESVSPGSILSLVFSSISSSGSVSSVCGPGTERLSSDRARGGGGGVCCSLG